MAQSASFALSIFPLWAPNEIKYTQLHTTCSCADLPTVALSRTGRLQVRNIFAIFRLKFKKRSSNREREKAI